MSEPVDVAYDRARMVELFGDDPGTLGEIERDFVETVRAAEREITVADDLAAVAGAAHRVKGASGMIGAGDLHKAAEALERLAKGGDAAGVRRSLASFSREVERVVSAVGA